MVKLHEGQVDNRSLGSKIALRNWLLSRMNLSKVSVLDTCAGAGHVWAEMQKHVTVEKWIRCDVKPRQAGTLMIEATDAVKSLPIGDFNVVDIDPYGEPWGAYAELLPRITRPTAVFLTCGRMSLKLVSHAALAFAGVPSSWCQDLPRSAYVSDFVGQTILERTWQFVNIEHSATVHMPKNNVQYYALGLSPLAGSGRRGK